MIVFSSNKHFFIKTGFLLFMIFLMLVPGVLKAEVSDSTVTIEDNTPKISNFSMPYYYDGDSSLNIQEIMKIDFNKAVPNRFALGYFKGTYWFKLLLQNHSSHTDFLLNLDMPWFDVVNVYSVEHGVISKSINGLNAPFEKIDISDTNPTFSLAVREGESKVFYIQMKCEFGATGNFTLYVDKASYVKDKVISTGLYMIYLGGSIIVVILNLFLFFTLKERIYVYYSFYVLTLSCYIMVMAGISGYIFYNLYKILNFLGSLNMIFFILFTKEILKTSFYTPRLNKLLNVFGIIFVLFVPLIIIDPSTWFQYFNNILIIALFLILFASILSWRKGNIDAKYYLVFMIFYISTLLVFSMLSLGYVEYSYFARYVFIYASFIEISFFALVLANRFNKTRDEKMAVEVRLREKEMYQEELEDRTNRDGLTGLYNRRYLTNRIVNLFQEMKSRNENLCVIMLDIDYFKRVNDNHGHLVGDIALKNTAATLKNFGRKDDIVVRYGGEEFLIIVANTTLEDAKMIAEKIRKSVETLEISYERDKVLKVTISVGVSQLKSEDVSIENVISRADRALYQSKEDGRNRVTVQ